MHYPTVVHTASWFVITTIDHHSLVCDYRLANQLGHLISTHENVYIEDMRSITGKFCKIPAMLLNLEHEKESKPFQEINDAGKKATGLCIHMCPH